MVSIRRVVWSGLVAALALTTLAAAAATRNGVLRGSTDQTFADGTSGTVRLQVSHHGRRLHSFDITWSAACDSGFTALVQGTHARGPLSRHGRFKGGGRYASAQGNLAGTQYTATVSDRLSGRILSQGRARGSFEATAVLKDGGGQPVSTCTSPPISWQAGR